VTESLRGEVSPFRPSRRSAKATSKDQRASPRCHSISRAIPRAGTSRFRGRRKLKADRSWKLAGKSGTRDGDGVETAADDRSTAPGAGAIDRSLLALRSTTSRDHGDWHILQAERGGRKERESHDDEGSGENSRANEIPRSRFSSGFPFPALFPFAFLSFFFFLFFLPSPPPATFFYFAARQRNTSAAAGSVSGPARSSHSARHCADEYLSERKTNSTSLSLSLSLPPSTSIPVLSPRG